MRLRIQWMKEFETSERRFNRIYAREGALRSYTEPEAILLSELNPFITSCHSYVPPTLEPLWGDAKNLGDRQLQFWEGGRKNPIAVSKLLQLILSIHQGANRKRGLFR